MNPSTISPNELHEKTKSGATIILIDVRTSVEYQEIHAVGARNIPLDTLEPKKLLTELGSNDVAIYMICRSGGRAGQACERMAAAGFTNMINVEGGTLAWEGAGLSVVRNREIISLERQIRITAGSLVLVGSLLTFFVHLYWIALPAFVGAGLIFAGVTNTCGMGILLAKMPWNRVKSDTPSSGESCSCSLRK